MEGLISPENTDKGTSFCTQQPISNDIISVAECKEYLGDQKLPDKNAMDIKNNLIGIVNSVINSYLNDFR